VRLEIKIVTIMELPRMNHLFQEAHTGAPSEYAEIEQTFSQWPWKWY